MRISYIRQLLDYKLHNHETSLSLYWSIDCFGDKLISHETVTELNLVFGKVKCETYFRVCLETGKESFALTDSCSQN